MKKISLFSLILLFAFAKDGFSDPIIATESFVRDGLATRVTNTEFTTIITAALSTKADLQAGAVAGNVATMDATGQYVDSGTALSSLASTASVDTGLATKSNLQTGAVAGNVATVDILGQYVDSGTALSSLASTASVDAGLATKSNLQTGAVAGNVATMNAAGQYIDSGSALSSLATTASVNTGLNTKLNLSGGTMTGAINMGNTKITNMATPTVSTDATTKAYVDAYNTAPSWATLSGQNWDIPGWGATWQASNGTSSVYGVSACLNTTTKSGTVPSTNVTGQYCWCKISNVNGIEASGAWVYNANITNSNTCYGRCPFYCGYCVRYSSYNSCSRSALFTAQ